MLSKITSWRHSKIIAFVLAVAVFLTAFYGLTPVISFAEGEASQGETAPTKTIWDGKKPTFAEAFAEQTEAGKGGSAEKPYEITTGAQLYAAVTYTEAVYFKLMNDIQLQSSENMEHLEALIKSGTPIPEGVTLYNWSRSPVIFKGHIDGDFHTVSGLYYVTSSYSNVGFINQSNGATIKNLTFDGTYMSAKAIMGGVVGYVGTGTTTIDGCSVINSKLANQYTYPEGVTNSDGKETVGGLVGTMYSSSVASYDIKNCAVLNTQITQALSSARIGGIWADSWSNKALGTISNCIVEGYAAFSRGAAYVSSYTNVFSTVSGNTAAADGTTVTVIDAKHLVGAELPGIDASTGWEIKDAEYPKYVGSNQHTVDSKVYWNGYKGFTDVTKLEGSGSQGDPYKIYYGYQLYAAVKSTSAKYFKLMNDIQLQSNDNMEELQKLINGDDADDSTLNDWGVSKTIFVGDIDGNFKTVSGVYIVGTAQNEGYGIGFITRTGKGASVKNLTLDTMYMTGPDKIGGIIAIHYGSGGDGDDLQITGCAVKNAKLHSTGVNDTQYDSVAGIIAAHWSGGLVNIDNCAVYDVDLANKTDSSRVAGIFGNNTWTQGHTIKNCISVGYKPNAANNYATCTNVYTTETYDITGVTDGLTEAQLKGAELPGIDASTGWKIAEGEYPEYTGVIGSRVQATPVVWNGLKLTSLDSLEGDGDAEHPYLIYNGDELYTAVTSTDAVHFKLMNDIQLQSSANMAVIDALIAASDPSTVDGTALNNWSRSTSTFTGTFDGNFHTVSGLYLYRTSTTGHNNGFISASQDATVKNLTLDKMYIDAKSRVGGVIGYISGTTTIDGCAVINSHIRNTRTDSDQSYDSIAGISAQAPNGTHTFNNCVVLNTKIYQATASTLGTKSGIFGDTWSAKIIISNCITEGIAPYTDTSTYLNGYTNVYTTVSGSSTAADSSKVTVADATALKGTELPGINASTGWEIKAGEWPKYTGVIGTRPTNTKSVWNGLKLTSLDSLDGEGTLEQPYLIYNGYELYAAVGCTDGSYFKLMNDIQLQSDDNMGVIEGLIANGGTNDSLNSWRYSSTASWLNLDGNFKTVSGLYQNETATGSYGLGFISRLKGGSSISNLTLDRMYVTGPNKIGGFIGLAYGAESGYTGFDISGCVLKNAKFSNTSDSTDTQFNGIGGIVGGHWSGGVIAVENCAIYDVEFISATGTPAGIFGDNVGSSSAHTIENSIVAGNMTKLANNGTRTNVHHSTTGDDLKGVNLAGINPTTGWVIAENQYPKYVGKGNIEHPVNTIIVWDGFNGFKDVTLLNGEGTEDKPYKIYYPYELFAALQNGEGKHFEIMNDFDLNNIPWRLWYSMTRAALATQKAFSGTLNGNGHTIYNYNEPTESGTYDNFAAQGMGLIPAAATATISNLHIRGVDMLSWSQTSAGVIVGVAKGNVTIDGCSVKATKLNVQNQELGGFIGEVTTGSAAITNSVFVGGTITSENKKGTYGSFIGNVADGATATLENVIANGYATVGIGTATESDVVKIGNGLGGYATVAGLKWELRSGKTLSDAFYYDYLSGNVPQLKNRLATKNVDIDGDEGDALDANDALALKNILLYGSDAQLTLSADKAANGYNDLEGVDITDLVHLYSITK